MTTKVSAVEAFSKDAFPEGGLPVFVYGTLQTGYGMHRVVQSDVDRSSGAVTDGSCWFAFEDGFPVAKFGTGETIVGEVLWFMEPCYGLDRAHQIEVGAGYEPVDVEVTLSDGSTVAAMAWETRHSTTRMDKVLNNDWAAWASRKGF